MSIKSSLFFVLYLEDAHDARPQNEWYDEGHDQGDVVEQVVDASLHSAVSQVHVAGSALEDRAAKIGLFDEDGKAG